MARSLPLLRRPYMAAAAFLSCPALPCPALPCRMAPARISLVSHTEGGRLLFQPPKSNKIINNVFDVKQTKKRRINPSKLKSPCLRCRGVSWPGLAWPGLAWPGLAWPGLYYAACVIWILASYVARATLGDGDGCGFVSPRRGGLAGAGHGSGGLLFSTYSSYSSNISPIACARTTPKHR